MKNLESRISKVEILAEKKRRTRASLKAQEEHAASDRPNLQRQPHAVDKYDNGQGCE